MKKHLFLPLLLLIVASCSGPKDGNLPVIDFVRDTKTGHDLPLSSIASSIEYVPLESCEGAFVGNYLQIEATDSTILVLDTQRIDNCKVFSRTGEFLGTIGRIGRGPNEMSSISKIQTSDNNVFLTSSDKLISFDINGNVLKTYYLREYVEGGRAETIYLGKDKLFVKWWRNDANNAIILDKDKVVYRFADSELIPQPTLVNEEEEIKLTIVGFQTIRSFAFWHHNNNIRLFSELTDTVYSVSTKNYETSPSFVLNFGKYKEIDGVSRPGTYISLTPFIIEKGQYLFLRPLLPDEGFDYRNPKGRLAYGIYDKESQKLKMLKHDHKYNFAGFVNDLDGGAPFWPMTIVGDTMYQAVDAMKFIEWSEISGSEKMKQVASTITDESNPVIVIAKMK